MDRSEKAIRLFFDWVILGLQLDDVEYISDCHQEAEIPPSVKPEVTAAIDDLMKVLIRFRKYNQQAIKKQLKRQNIVDVRDWKKTANGSQP